MGSDSSKKGRGRNRGRCSIISSLIVVATVMLLFVFLGHHHVDSSSVALYFVSSTEDKTHHQSTVPPLPGNDTYPLILGDPSGRQPTELLIQNYTFQKQHCNTYSHGKEFGCSIEWDEWILAQAFVLPGDVVMEFGARYGTTSCVLSAAVGPTGAVVSVDPDSTVHEFLLRNRVRHSCGFHALLGTVGPTPQFIQKRAGYGTQTSQEKQKGALRLPNMELNQVERLIGRTFNVALIDCEGCITSVNETGLFDQVDVILMEEDMLATYQPWHKTLRDKGFICTWYTKDTVDLKKAWSRKLRHSAWLRQGTQRKYPTCAEFAAQAQLPSKLLTCSECPT